MVKLDLKGKANNVIKCNKIIELCAKVVKNIEIDIKVPFFISDNICL